VFNADTSTITLTSLNPNITTKGIGSQPFWYLTLNNGGVLLSSVQVDQDLSIAGVLNTNNQANLTVLGSILGPVRCRGWPGGCRS